MQDNPQGIGRTETHQLTKQDLLKMVEENFSYIDGHVAVLTTVYSRDFGVHQTITFVKEVRL